MTREIFTAAALGILFGVIIGFGIINTVSSHIDQAAITEALR